MATILKAPSKNGSCSWQGQEFQIVDGLAEVDDEAVLELLSHGFTLPDETAQAPQVPSTPIAQWRTVDLKAKAVELGLQLPDDIERPALISAVADAIKNQGQQVGQ